MRVVVVGGTGQLGRELVRALPGADTVALSRAQLDLTAAPAVAPRLAALAPSVVVNAAADNRVDAAERDPAPALAVNALGVAALAEACRATGALLVHMSTDYVFDGRAARPYAEDDPPNPLGAYARSKLEGERLAQALAPRHAVVRVAGLYAAGGGGFVDRVLARARAGRRLRVVHDQVTAPTWARDVATALARLLPRLASGCYGRGAGASSRSSPSPRAPPGSRMPRARPGARTSFPVMVTSTPRDPPASVAMTGSPGPKGMPVENVTCAFCRVLNPCGLLGRSMVSSSSTEQRVRCESPR